MQDINMYTIAHNERRERYSIHYRHDQKMYEYVIDMNDFALSCFENPPKCKYKNKKWKFEDDTKLLYTHDTNTNKVYLCNLIKKQQYNHGDYFVFKDGDPFNLRLTNIVIQNIEIDDYQKYITENISENNKLMHYHTNDRGKTANRVKNPIWKIDNKEKYLIMYCETNKYTKLSLEDFENVTKDSLTFYSSDNGYIYTRFNDKLESLHSLIYYYKENSDLCFKDFKTTYINQNLSIDHINQDKLDNRRSNLRVVTQSLQNVNRGKKTRMAGARQLPDALVDYLASINKTALPKFVTYNVDTVKGPMDHHYQREFFRIESQELLTRMGKCSWASSKSTKVSIVDKYKQTVAMIHKVQTQAINETTTTMKDLVIVDGAVVEKKTIPIPYTNMAFSRGKHCMVFDQRDANGKRLNLKMTIKTAEPTEADVEKFKNNLHKKYPDVKIHT